MIRRYNATEVVVTEGMGIGAAVQGVGTMPRIDTRAHPSQ